MNNQAGALIRASKLTLHRGDKRVIANAAFSIRAGEITVVLGPNGAGKSSLLLAMAGLIPAEGELLLNDSAVASLDRAELAESVAWQGELPPTEFGLTVYQRLELAQQSGEIETVAAEMDIAPLLSRTLGELSSGERQRVELAALALRDAPLWLLDEPTAHLDLKHQIACLQMIRREAAGGRGIVTVLHDLQQAMAIADHLILVDGNGGAEYGDATKMFESERLSALFEVPLVQKGGVFMPDYGGKQ